MTQQICFCTSFDGTRIAYSTTGSGPPLVRVANWVTHLERDLDGPIWPPWFEELSRNHTLVRYDLRGSGLSDRQVDDLSLEAWVKDLEAVVDDLGLDAFSILGLCQGGSIAIAYAVRHPDRVRKLVLYDAYTHGALVEGQRVFERAKAEALTQMIKVGWGRRNAAFRKVFADLLVPDGTKEQQLWLAELQRESTSPEMAARLWRAFHKVDVRDLAPRVQSPALVFHVTSDAMIPFAMGRRLASLLPDARFIPLDGNNHILLPDEPAWERFISELHGFLGEGPRGEVNAFSDLTPREREVLDLMARGLSNSKIAEELFISPKTVRNHVTRVFSKLEVGRRAAAIVTAREAGFGRDKA
jgi:pimeloyl-ACP methyl ester carboxylesterase/DNA-binding CsgD family transcriptional regulator